MSESKGKIIFAILAVLLLLFGGGVTLYPFLNGLWAITALAAFRMDWVER